MSHRDIPVPSGNPFEDSRDRREREMFAPVEALIRAAGNYVRPSDDLRPSTLEAARYERGTRRWKRHLSAVAAVVVLLAIGNVPARFVSTDVAERTASATVTREFELREQAAKSSGLAFNPSWAWFEAFWELRHQQASRINE